MLTFMIGQPLSQQGKDGQRTSGEIHMTIIVSVSSGTAEDLNAFSLERTF